MQHPHESANDGKEQIASSVLQAWVKKIEAANTAQNLLRIAADFIIPVNGAILKENGQEAKLAIFRKSFLKKYLQIFSTNSQSYLDTASSLEDLTDQIPFTKANNELLTFFSSFKDQLPQLITDLRQEQAANTVQPMAEFQLKAREALQKNVLHLVSQQSTATVDVENNQVIGINATGKSVSTKLSDLYREAILINGDSTNISDQAIKEFLWTHFPGSVVEKLVNTLNAPDKSIELSVALAHLGSLLTQPYDELKLQVTLIGLYTKTAQSKSEPQDASSGRIDTDTHAPIADDDSTVTRRETPTYSPEEIKRVMRLRLHQLTEAMSSIFGNRAIPAENPFATIHLADARKQEEILMMSDDEALAEYTKSPTLFTIHPPIAPGESLSNLSDYLPDPKCRTCGGPLKIASSVCPHCGIPRAGRILIYKGESSSPADMLKLLLSQSDDIRGSRQLVAAIAESEGRVVARFIGPDDLQLYSLDFDQIISLIAGQVDSTRVKSPNLYIDNLSSHHSDIKVEASSVAIINRAPNPINAQCGTLIVTGEVALSSLSSIQTLIVAPGATVTRPNDLPKNSLIKVLVAEGGTFVDQASADERKITLSSMAVSEYQTRLQSELSKF